MTDDDHSSGLAENDEPGLRQISDEELERILEEHERWVESEGKEGTRADLSRAHLSRRNLQEANLERANLQDASLWEADLEKTYLWGGFLRGANLRGAKLTNTNLRGSTLLHTDLRRAWFDPDQPPKVEYLLVDGDTLAVNPPFKRVVQYQRLKDYTESWPKPLAPLRWAFRVLSDYGRKPWRWGIGALLLAVLFGLIYMPAPSWLPSWWPTPLTFNEPFATGWSPFYFSVVTLTTLGFGDYTPTSVAAEIAVMTEVLIGYLMLGFLLALLAHLIRD